MPSRELNGVSRFCALDGAASIVWPRRQVSGLTTILPLESIPPLADARRGVPLILSWTCASGFSRLLRPILTVIPIRIPHPVYDQFANTEGFGLTVLPERGGTKEPGSACTSARNWPCCSAGTSSSRVSSARGAPSRWSLRRSKQWRASSSSKTTRPISS